MQNICICDLSTGMKEDFNQMRIYCSLDAHGTFHHLYIYVLLNVA